MCPLLCRCGGAIGVYFGNSACLDDKHRPPKYTYLISYLLTHNTYNNLYNNYRRRLKIVIHEREDKTACTIKH